jgi:hypothetical protein
VGRAIRGVAREPDDPAMEAFGYLGKGASVAVLRRALTDVIVPGFETLGVDLSYAQATIARLACA